MQAITQRGARPRTHGAADLEQWRSAIAQGNGAFDTSDYACAVRHYRRALSIAQDLFGQGGGVRDADAGVAALVVAHHNLADACERLDRHAEQGAQLCAAHEKLCAAMDDPNLDEPWRQAALRHSRRTYTELTRFVSRHPDHARARALLACGAAGPAGEVRVQ